MSAQRPPGTTSLACSLNAGNRIKEMTHDRRADQDQHRPERTGRQRASCRHRAWIPDEALAPGQELPEPPSEDEVKRIAELLGAPVPANDGAQ
jgi:hypothetical protein